MSILRAAIIAGCALSVPVPAPQVDASKLTVSTPTQAVELDVGKLKGELWRLAWSPDGRQIYIQTVERNRTGVTARHYLVGLDGAPATPTDGEPIWAQAYWMWKAGRSAPGVPEFKIDLEQEQRRASATSTPMGGDLARGAPEGSSPTGLGNPQAAAQQSQMVGTTTLRLKGEVVGNFVNAPPVPGMTFGWGPMGSGLIAFANPDGRLVLMDIQGRKQEVPSSKEVVWPAFTNDGKRVAYLQKTGRKKFQLTLVDVTRPSL